MNTNDQSFEKVANIMQTIKGLGKNYIDDVTGKNVAAAKNVAGQVNETHAAYRQSIAKNRLHEQNLIQEANKRRAEGGQWNQYADELNKGNPHAKEKTFTSEPDNADYASAYGLENEAMADDLMGRAKAINKERDAMYGVLEQMDKIRADANAEIAAQKVRRGVAIGSPLAVGTGVALARHDDKKKAQQAQDPMAMYTTASDMYEGFLKMAMEDPELAEKVAISFSTFKPLIGAFKNKALSVSQKLPKPLVRGASNTKNFIKDFSGMEGRALKAGTGAPKGTIGSKAGTGFADPYEAMRYNDAMARTAKARSKVAIGAGVAGVMGGIGSNASTKSELQKYQQAYGPLQ